MKHGGVCHEVLTFIMQRPNCLSIHKQIGIGVFAGKRVTAHAPGKDINAISRDGEDPGCRVITLSKVCGHLIEDDNTAIRRNIVICLGLKGDVLIWGT